MDFFLLNTAGDLNDPELAFVEDPPEDIDIYDYCLALGESAVPYYPDDAKIYLRKENPGIKLAGLLGNSKGYFLGTSAAKQVIESLCPDSEIEFLPFTLYNHKRRVHSKDYFFINPIGGFDCLNEKACNIVYDEDGDVESMDQLVLDANKLQNAPHLFRIDKDPIKYVISRQLGEALAGQGVTNIRGEPLQVQ